MEPTSRYPFNVRSFFTDHETQDIGAGIHLWRGYFQSVRPAIGRMLINLDISTAAMYQPGPLINLCLRFLNRDPSQPQILSQAHGFPERERIRLQRHIQGIRITTDGGGQQGASRVPRAVKKITGPGADALSFTTRDGDSLTVSQYFQRTYNRPLRYPKLPCVEVRASLCCIVIIFGDMDDFTGWEWRPHSSRGVRGAARSNHEASGSARVDVQGSRVRHQGSK